MIHLVTGGARSGKSAWAEEQIRQIPYGTRIYIATMDPGDDPENHRRIAKHRIQRAGKGFQTIESPVGLDAVVLPEDSVVLLECLTNLVANEMFSPSGAGQDTLNAVLRGVDSICRQARDVFFITSDVFADGADFSGDVRVYQQILADVVRHIAAAADDVTELVYGIPIRHAVRTDSSAQKKGDGKA